MSFLKVLDAAERSRLVKRYQGEEYVFPLIMSVLSGRQEGVVYANKPESPEVFFVEHKFGFSQICGELDTCFAEALADYLFVRQDFAPGKIRCYAPGRADYFTQGSELCERSSRARFRLVGSIPDEAEPPDADCVEIHSGNFDEINARFGIDLSNRFWRSREDFLAHAFGAAVLCRGEVASICYSAAIADGVAEIDVATIDSARRRGLGKIAVSAFVHQCEARGVTPNWDCFTNNSGSVRLAASVGFAMHGSAYDFFTIPKAVR